jgi:flagellar protein FlaG
MEIPGIKEAHIRQTTIEPSQKGLKKPSQPTDEERATADSIKRISGEQAESVRQLVENLNQFMRSIDYNLQFVPDQEAGIVVIKVLDGNGKVIRQIPPEAILSLSSRIGESMGVFINSKL